MAFERPEFRVHFAYQLNVLTEHSTKLRHRETSRAISPVQQHCQVYTRSSKYYEIRIVWRTSQ